MSESWRPRPHDHLVEPFLGGLGHEAPADTGRRSSRWSAVRVLGLALLVSALVLVALALAS